MLDLAKTDKIAIQSFVNRSDSQGGSTLGAISGTQVSIQSVDIGLPQLAMHSTIEMSGVKDTRSMYDLLLAYYSKHIIIGPDFITINE